MLDDFFIRALIAGIGIAIVTGPLGCFIVWRKMAYFGDTMAHSALLGVALAVLFNISIIAGVFAIAGLVSLLLVTLQKRVYLPGDSLMGIASHASLAVGLVLIGLMSEVRIDLMGLLFGDILAVSTTDIFVIYAGGAVVLVTLLVIWRPLLIATINEELAIAEGHNPERTKLIFMLALAGVVAMAIKIVGVLLVTSLLIIPAAAARRFSSSPEKMVLFACLAGIISVVSGLFASLQLDTSSGPSVVVAALLLFVISILPAKGGNGKNKREQAR